MKKLWIIPITLIALAMLMLIVDIAAVKETTPSSTEPANADAPQQSHIDSSSTAAPTKPDPRLTRLPDGHVHYKPALATSRAITADTPPHEALIHIEQLLTHYRFAYKENPVGVENFEITEQLLGKNPKKIIFIAPDSPALRGNELIDQWGTPYFFHALSGQEMDIRSAGPDHELWTADDVFLKQVEPSVP
ncbi:MULTISPECIES: hypothetical protein [unclassified Lentimonas]|uniref:hypothetical protein n=1 Tax=unclassified Lentimonas TaxID=2630993 RepID=UPI0013234FFB|nr:MULTISPECIES: hypothetical protein [unclassified Lentimonas]CAA6676702.1 Unannotated [Lentimonas sp. CC4]CAA6684633.1 Unannotated [Lentimonas sp. CC6]CAA7075269.1 Unannotated [Lentimonas sp. CC4]CAA7170654.1 Unannotated [Lentimonas sp. CC21]CAA7182323.1 Unannotated [Lentimonas sp. CC8]